MPDVLHDRVKVFMSHLNGLYLLACRIAFQSVADWAVGQDERVPAVADLCSAPDLTGQAASTVASTAPS